MSHTNYFEIQADSYYNLGVQEGQLFKQHLINSINKAKQHKSWKLLSSKSKSYLKPTQIAFPHLVEELQGYAKGAGVSFDDLWIRILKTELPDIDKCTTVITNCGKLLAHNEDWDANSQDAICVIKKSVGDLTIFELFYYNTLGGNTISVNSHGVVQSINTLTHTDERVGIPRNIVARWMSETENPTQDYSKFSTLHRASGYSHNFVDVFGNVYSLESSAFMHAFKNVDSPFVHTNHYLSELKELEHNDNLCGTFDRYKYAFQNTKKSMSLNGLQKLMDDKSNGSKTSVFNERTIARMIVDLEKFVAYVWLLRESEKGWMQYNIDFFNH